MKQFSLQTDQAVLNFDTDGNVHDTASNHVGRWGTDGKNQIVVNKGGGGGSLAVAVDWAFDENNRLTISQGGKVVFTLANTTDGLPGYRIDKDNRLVVDPDGDRDFEFALTCQYGFDEHANLVVAINGQASVLDGFVEDNASRFRFMFDDREMPTFPSSLVFNGEWQRVTSAANEIRLQFVLQDPAQQLAGKALVMPAAARVDPTRNHLVVVYASKTKGERRLQFQGSFRFGENYTLEFRIDQVKDGGVRKSSITVDATFEFDVVRGALQLYVGKTRTASSQVLEIGGSLQARLKQGQLTWTFAYRKATSGGQSVVTLATQLEFVFKNGKVLISYTQNGKTRTLDVTAKLVRDDFAVSGGLSIVNDPGGRQLKAFVGISW